MNRFDLQWWAGGVAAMVGAFVAVAALPHPWDTYGLGVAAALGAFAMYKITPSGSTKE